MLLKKAYAALNLTFSKVYLPPSSSNGDALSPTYHGDTEIKDEGASRASVRTHAGKQPIVLSEEDLDSADVSQQIQAPNVKNKRPRLDPAPDQVDADGFLEDIDVQEITLSAPTIKTPSRNCDKFFSKLFDSSLQNGDGKVKKHCNCTICKKTLVADISTLRRHLGAYHALQYRAWALKENFKSMIPADVKSRREAIAKEKAKQCLLDDHLKEMPKKERIVAYSHQLFRSIAIEWLIATGQPLLALEHPTFKKMIDIAARAQDGVEIPLCKVAHEELLDMFRQRMSNLKATLNSNKVPGDINLTCDAWQASNVDGYFATTAYWIETVVGGQWKL
ncbi:hypothetical protein EW026_g4311 [Hermanssonia centrifuga]|uniref:BED-type domain-containing protein n=1 Tax=Hermanssonia centrifuga TaxID=98765 RepID=A0A4S4KHJ6_9APHY|nr:hypothetical protein EW026_g4311 [Hermanssonia centrifuga]